ncbi:NTP/NDP exchange transporter [Rufibacter glacialis]|uniref:NTP/NDP exchange transporter n=1 Tax=Rufibacter glacialis TaxID=1259555 RepID=A0A5M8QTE7_9BACT|nr:hypothetical protein [Rufibacter glacialis]KAA6437472.1 hypothetical protein FOE74_02930 [Rufibacter glacialis]GGK59083.1 hypothetical protein GCM10011405_03900 [Rufibacter glacialis]
MNSKIIALLNIRSAEAQVVKQLFLVQLFLGIATSTLFTSTLAMFLNAFEVTDIPKVYIVSAGLLLVTNLGYAQLETRLSAKKLLQIVILFSSVTLFFSWAGVMFYSEKLLPFFLSAWNMVVYMLVGYAFWGMASIIFNVRESKRLFSVVGSGDIPAKLLGYTAVSVLAPVLGVESLLGLSIGSFLLAYFFLARFEHRAISSHDTLHEPAHRSPRRSFIARYFHNPLIFAIAMFSLAAFTVYSLIDYTFLAEVKSRFKSSPDMASFLGMFFAVGRVVALLVKLMLSSRVISRLGLSNSLLIAPGVLLAITLYLLLPRNSENAIFIIFGVMVLVSEVLKSAVQEPSFLVLFQPLHPHARLKGHLISKGYTMPFALLATGIFLVSYNHWYGPISITLVCQILAVLLVAWIFTVFQVKTQYLRALVIALRKGFFTGTELFLNEESVRKILLDKLDSGKPKEVIMALELLERSAYQGLEDRLLPLLQSPNDTIKKYVLSRIVALKLSRAFPLIEKTLQEKPYDPCRPDFIKAFYSLTPQPIDIPPLERLEVKKAALVGLAHRPEETARALVQQHLKTFTHSQDEAERLAVLDIYTVDRHKEFLPSITVLLLDSSPKVHKRALETAGKTKDPSLLPQILRTGQSRKSLYALQNALVHFGDAAFAPHHVPQRQALSEDLTLNFIRAAGKVKGDFSTQFLEQQVGHGALFPDEAIEALWYKNAVLQKEGRKQVQGWLKTKLWQSRKKALYCQCLAKGKEFPLLEQALASETKQDIKYIMRSLALLYDRQRINRVMDMLSIGSAEKIANAIEMLEQLIPKRCFIVVESLLDFHLDKEKRWGHSKEKTTLSTSHIIKEIISENPAGCSAWVKSVACYSILALPTPELTQAIAPEPSFAPDALYSETRAFVINQLSTLRKRMRYAANRESPDLKFL